MENKEKKIQIPKDNPITFFSIVCYEPILENDFIDLGVSKWAFIIHNKDIDDDGKIITPHYHYFLKIPHKKRISTLEKYFKEHKTQNFLVQACKSESSLIRYFVHNDNELKHQYDIEEIISNYDISFAFTTLFDDDEFLTDVTRKVLTGELNSYKSILEYALENNKIRLISSKAYYLKSLTDLFVKKE